MRQKKARIVRSRVARLNIRALQYLRQPGAMEKLMRVLFGEPHTWPDGITKEGGKA